MKLNNKGFAITAVLYGLLILFVVLIGSYLTLLGTKKSRLDIITSDIEKDYEFKKLNNMIKTIEEARRNIKSNVSWGMMLRVMLMGFMEG